MSRPKRCQAMASATVCVCDFSQWFILPWLETWCWKPLAGSQLTSRPRSGAPTLTLQPTVWILRICPSCISLIICSIIWSVVDNMQGAKDEPYGGNITFQEWFSTPTLQQKFSFLQASCILAWIVCRLGCGCLLPSNYLQIRSLNNSHILFWLQQILNHVLKRHIYILLLGCANLEGKKKRSQEDQRMTQLPSFSQCNHACLWHLIDVRAVAVQS